MLKDENGGDSFPAYKKGTEWLYVGVDDTRELFGYMRQNGDIVSVPYKMASCARSYQMTAPLRVVFFKDSEERDFDELTRQLASFTFTQNVTLVKIITDKFRLIREESPVFRDSPKFDGKTFYIAIDIFISFILQASDCESENCNSLPNPIQCLVVAPRFTESATS